LPVVVVVVGDVGEMGVGFVWMFARSFMPDVVVLAFSLPLSLSSLLRNRYARTDVRLSPNQLDSTKPNSYQSAFQLLARLTD
jgi:hypothetical protein